VSQLSLTLDKPGFIIDTMVLIGIGRLIYPPELKKSAREIVDKLVDEGKVKSSIEVHAELFYKKKDLKATKLKEFSKELPMKTKKTSHRY